MPAPTSSISPTYCSGPEEWQPGCGWCATCGNPLDGKSRWFCRARRGDAQSCRRRWLDNHFWGDARRAAIKRDRRCVKCGNAPGAPRGTRLEVNHIAALADQKFAYGRSRGARYASGCQHHQEGLETLCVPCHRTVTAEQKRARGVYGGAAAEARDKEKLARWTERA